MHLLLIQLFSIDNSVVVARGKEGWEVDVGGQKGHRDQKRHCLMQRKHDAVCR